MGECDFFQFHTAEKCVVLWGCDFRADSTQNPSIRLSFLLSASAFKPKCESYRHQYDNKEDDLHPAGRRVPDLVTVRREVRRDTVTKVRDEVANHAINPASFIHSSVTVVQIPREY